MTAALKDVRKRANRLLKPECTSGRHGTMPLAGGCAHQLGVRGTEVFMFNSAIEQEIADACTSMEVVCDSARRGDSAMMTAALKDVRKRANRLLKVLNAGIPSAALDPQMPTEPRSPIKEGEI
jgi:hypothetical protein